MTLEKFPDEILLTICRYLSPIDILYSFYGLNSRINQTITDYCRHISLKEVSYKRLTHICSTIIPEIGSCIYSLTVSNEWTGKLSKVFLEYFGQEKISIFPRLKRITLIALSTTLLLSFLDGLINLPDLNELNISCLHRKSIDLNEMQVLLDRLFRANDCRLSRICYDHDSMAFSISKEENHSLYSNIKKLDIIVETLDDLHKLLNLLPEVEIVNIALQHESIEFDKEEKYCLVENLIEFHLTSLSYSFNLDELLSILNRLPKIEKLSVEVESEDDLRLINGNDLNYYLSSFNLKQFNYFVRYASICSIDRAEILSTWEQFSQEINCLISDDGCDVILFTIPSVFSNITISNKLSKNILSLNNCFHQIETLYLYGVPDLLSEIFPILNKCKRIKYLILEVDDQINIKPTKEIYLCKLFRLTHISLLQSSVESKSFGQLLQSSPNVFDLNIHSTILHSLLDEEPLCRLFDRQITHLYILILKSDNIKQVTLSVNRLSSIFKELKHLYINMNMINETFEPLALSVFNQLPEWSTLISFGIVGMSTMLDKFQEDVRQWLLEKAPFDHSNTFTTEYSEGGFRLWL